MWFVRVSVAEVNSPEVVLRCLDCWDDGGASSSCHGRYLVPGTASIIAPGPRRYLIPVPTKD